MGKILQISIYSVLLILVFLLFGSMLKSCGNSATDTIKDTTQKVADNIENAGGEIVAKAESAIDKVEEEFEGDDIDFSDSDSGTTSYQASSTDEEDYEPSYVVEDTEEPVAAEPVKKEPIKTTSSTSSSASKGSSSGNYLLITGSYSQESNASEMVKKLKKKGFSNAEYVIFEGSRYYTAIAGKYSSMSSANAAKRDLGSIDSYVQKKRN